MSKKSATSNGLAPLGKRSQLVRELARFNTAPETAGEDDVLYGPGIRLELPPGQDPAQHRKAREHHGVEDGQQRRLLVPVAENAPQFGGMPDGRDPAHPAHRQRKAVQRKEGP